MKQAVVVWGESIANMTCRKRLWAQDTRQSQFRQTHLFCLCLRAIEDQMPQTSNESLFLDGFCEKPPAGFVSQILATGQSQAVQGHPATALQGMQGRKFCKAA
jgi:hypothetical protein